MAGGSLIRAGVSALLVLSPALGTTATADDGGDGNAGALVREAQRNVLDATSLRLTLTDRAAAGKSAEVASMDLTLDRDGNCVGSFRMGRGGGSFDVVKRGDEVWMKADRAYWRSQLHDQGNKAADVVRDRYVHGTTNEGTFKDFAHACDLKALQKELSLNTSSDDSMRTDGRTKIHGVDVIRLRGTEDGVPTTLYITTDSPHRLVEAVQKGDGTDDTAGVSDYGKPVPSRTPAPGDSVDLSDLEKESGRTG
ncbi:hypothetical protein [Streptomyces cyanogenus]|uniref:Lipoprotein n=1 Tax=Streptomyces cyanogenus TaxID=80860 RepID=A0ABX7TUL9_STRCY|nr:hypothetical protein [Streptomyces cyanogenus]QTE00431.1 hypothetical protein S1361_24080 [Streptomyces cyanogenus]